MDRPEQSTRLMEDLKSLGALLTWTISGRANGLAQIEALIFVAGMLAQEIELHFGLDPFGNHGESERMGHGDDVPAEEFVRALASLVTPPSSIYRQQPDSI